MDTPFADISNRFRHSHIRMALLNAPSKRIAVVGMGTLMTVYRTWFKNQTSANAPHNSTEWLNDLGNSTKLNCCASCVVDSEGLTVRAILKLESKEGRSVSWIQVQDPDWCCLAGSCFHYIGCLQSIVAADDEGSECDQLLYQYHEPSSARWRQAPRLAYTHR